MTSEYGTVHTSQEVLQAPSSELSMLLILMALHSRKSANLLGAKIIVPSNLSALALQASKKSCFLSERCPLFAHYSMSWTEEQGEGEELVIPVPDVRRQWLPRDICVWQGLKLHITLTRWLRGVYRLFKGREGSECMLLMNLNPSWRQRVNFATVNPVPCTTDISTQRRDISGT